jgi:phosphohistidine phosphatase
MSFEASTATAPIVVIVRHADALSGGPDRERPLSPQGVAQASRVAERLAALGLDLGEIWHSGRERARHTAAILARGCGAWDPIAVDGLEPNDDPDEIVTELEADPRPLVLVAHMPLVGRLASRLLTGDADGAPVILPTAGALVLRRVNDAWQQVASL